MENEALLDQNQIAEEIRKLECTITRMKKIKIFYLSRDSPILAAQYFRYPLCSTIVAQYTCGKCFKSEMVKSSKTLS